MMTLNLSLCTKYASSSASWRPRLKYLNLSGCECLTESLLCSTLDLSSCTSTVTDASAFGSLSESHCKLSSTLSGFFLYFYMDSLVLD
jgi:hypothetical protein